MDDYDSILHSKARNTLWPTETMSDHEVRSHVIGNCIMCTCTPSVLTVYMYTIDLHALLPVNKYVFSDRQIQCFPNHLVFILLDFWIFAIVL